MGYNKFLDNGGNLLPITQEVNEVFIKKARELKAGNTTISAVSFDEEGNILGYEINREEVVGEMENVSFYYVFGSY